MIAGRECSVGRAPWPAAVDFDCVGMILLAWGRTHSSVPAERSSADATTDSAGAPHFANGWVHRTTLQVARAPSERVEPLSSFITIIRVRRHRHPTHPKRE